MKYALAPIARTKLVRFETLTFVRTVRVALFVTALDPPVILTLYVPALTALTFEIVRELFVLPGRTPPFLRHSKRYGVGPEATVLKATLSPGHATTFVRGVKEFFVPPVFPASAVLPRSEMHATLSAQPKLRRL